MFSLQCSKRMLIMTYRGRAKTAKNNPRKRIGTPEDIAGVTLFLSSRAGAYIVGQVIVCDGGIVNYSHKL